MTEPLSRRCALVIFVAMGCALLAGLLAWGPIPLQAEPHRHADGRAWLGIPHAANVLSALALCVAGIWGGLSVRASRWPAELRWPWLGFHGFVVGAGLFAGIDHASPHPLLHLLAHACAAGAFTLLTMGVLAERVHAGFGAPRAVAAAALLVLGATLLVAAAPVHAGVPGDLRPLVLLEALPVLLIPAGALGMPGEHTRRVDWMVLLAVYAAGKAFDLADSAIFGATGVIGGHALMHLCLAAITAWLAWLAYAAALVPPGAPGEASIQRQTSLNTAG